MEKEFDWNDEQLVNLIASLAIPEKEIKMVLFDLSRASIVDLAMNNPRLYATSKYATMYPTLWFASPILSETYPA